MQIVFFLSSASLQLDLLGQKDGEFTRLLGAILPMGFIAQFIVGAFKSDLAEMSCSFTISLSFILYRARD